MRGSWPSLRTIMYCTCNSSQVPSALETSRACLPAAEPSGGRCDLLAHVSCSEFLCRLSARLRCCTSRYTAYSSFWQLCCTPRAVARLRHASSSSWSDSGLPMLLASTLWTAKLRRPSGRRIDPCVAISALLGLISICAHHDRKKACRCLADPH